MLVGEQLTWDDFQALFLEEYHLESLCEQRAIEFETLTCVSCGSVDTYAQKFVELCLYSFFGHYGQVKGEAIYSGFAFRYAEGTSWPG